MQNKKASVVQRVLIIQAEMKHYRLPFFTGLDQALREDGIELTVAYSNSSSIQAPRQDRAELPPPLGKRIEGKWLFGRFLYQHLWKEIFASDLVIIGPEAKYLLNPMLMLMSKLGMKTVAFWGLGPNKHPDRSPVAEWVKQHFFTCVDWWFAYTASIAEYLRTKGMQADKITDVQNATDTAGLRALLREISDEEAAKAKEILTGSKNSLIGLYCGLIGEIKALPLLLDAARLVKEKCPEFHLVLVGNGPDRAWLERAIADYPWIHYLGFKGHQEGAIYYRMADVFLLAGTVGLAVVDSFAAGLPLIATRLETHPPEISYVVDGYNGLLTHHDVQSFSNAILDVFSNSSLRARLQQGARESGSQYTMAAMVENYRNGIKRCLARYSQSSSAEVSHQLTNRSESQ
jgi:glycosyltransferase involved in cell wall biosynthesis